MRESNLKLFMAVDLKGMRERLILYVGHIYLLLRCTFIKSNKPWIQIKIKLLLILDNKKKKK